MQGSYEQLPDSLPVPTDDGACDHLVGMNLPDLPLETTVGKPVNLAREDGRTVVYCYPMTGQPGVPLPAGWDEIPGARGCTPQSCSFRDHFAELKALGAGLYGMSTQTTDYQREMAERLHLPYPIISDHQLLFCTELKLPTFVVEGKTLLKRVTLIAFDGVIEAVHYPVFPSYTDPGWVIAYIQSRSR